MRSTRAGEYDIYVAPAHVAASALAHGYMVAHRPRRDLPARCAAEVAIASRPQGQQDYLTQQDSAAYIARGMLSEPANR
jgi:hypothetical protein